MRFELTEPFGSAVFRTAGINRSPTLPICCQFPIRRQMPAIFIEAFVGGHRPIHIPCRVLRVVAGFVADLAALFALRGFDDPMRHGISKSGGECEIRTRGAFYGHASLAVRCFNPLSQLSEFGGRVGFEPVCIAIPDDGEPSSNSRPTWCRRGESNSYAFGAAF